MSALHWQNMCPLSVMFPPPHMYISVHPVMLIRLMMLCSLYGLLCIINPLRPTQLEFIEIMVVVIWHSSWFLLFPLALQKLLSNGFTLRGGACISNCVMTVVPHWGLVVAGVVPSPVIFAEAVFACPLYLAYRLMSATLYWNAVEEGNPSGANSTSPLVRRRTGIITSTIAVLTISISNTMSCPWSIRVGSCFI